MHIEQSDESPFDQESLEYLFSLPAAGQLLRSLTGEVGQVVGVAFSLDGRLLASGSGDKTVWLWGVDPTVTAQEDEAERQSLCDDPLPSKQRIVIASVRAIPDRAASAQEREAEGHQAVLGGLRGTARAV